MSVKSNIPKAMKAWISSIEELKDELSGIEGALAVEAMREVKKKGLIKGELQKNSKTQYADIQISDPHIIVHRAKSRRGWKYSRLKDHKDRKRKFAERPNRALPRIKKVFHKRRIAVRTGNFFRMFDVKNEFRVNHGKLIQRSDQLTMEVEKYKKDGTKSITFKFSGNEGVSLRSLSRGYGKARPIKLDNGKQLKGKKGKRDVVANAIRRTFNKHNRVLKKHIDSDYAKRFNKIK